MVSRFRTAATGKRPSSSWHTLCRLLDAANLATLLTVAHTAPLCMKGIQTPSVLRDTYQHVPHPPHTHTHPHTPLRYSTLLISTKVRFSSRRFPRLIVFDKLSSQVDGLLTWTTTTTKTLSTTLRQRQTTHHNCLSVIIAPHYLPSAFGTEYLATSMDSESFGTAHLEQSV